MEKQKHTAEPWSARFAVVEKDNKSIARCVGESQAVSDGNALAYANAARIVACVNALAGMNPGAVAGVVAALGELVAEFDADSDRAMNEPGHGPLNETGGIVLARMALAKINS